MGTDKILVTGAAGFIGSSLCDRLLADGQTVVGMDSFEDYYPREIKEDNLAGAVGHTAFTLLEQNILDADLAAALEGARCVYHLAAQAGVRASWGTSFDVYARNNVLATQRLLEACVAAGVPKVVYASSSSVYGDQTDLPLREHMTPRPRSPYGVTKLAGEHLCLLYTANHGLDTTSLRFFTVYGPRQRPDMAFHKFIRAMTEGREIAMYGDGTQTRDFTYVDDIVGALVSASGAGAGTVMNIGGGHRLSLSEAISLLSTTLGIDPKITRLPVEAGDMRDTWADVSRAAAGLGYRPTTALADGLDRECAWFAARFGVPV
jgi:nucleoside-diphosphate-sugar epimerase